MDTFLRAVGLVAEPPSLQASPGVVTYRSPATGSGGYPGEAPRGLDLVALPDLAVIAASTERGILTLEEEARSLERASLYDGLALVRRWAQGLRRRPRADEPLASFRAQFLRSNALERAVEALRRNELLWRELSDPPLLSSASPASAFAALGGESLGAELTATLQLCLPRAAAALAGPLLRAIFVDSLDRASAALATARVLREDWTEVVQAQALRGLERRLDSLTYELQKTPPPAKPGRQSEFRAVATRRTSQERILVLALVCEALEDAQRRQETRSDEVCRSLKEMGLDVSSSAYADTATAAAPIAGRGALGGAVAVEAPISETSSVTSPLPSPELRPSGATPARAAGSGETPLLEEADCEAAVNAMLLATEEGMQAGLRRLGLPDAPLHFVPGEELRLCGHDIRASVKTLIEHWLGGERSEFDAVLERIRLILDDKHMSLRGDATPQASHGSEPRSGGSGGGGSAGSSAKDRFGALSVGRIDLDALGDGEVGLCGGAELPADERGLRELRASLLEERAVLSSRLREVDLRLGEVESRLRHKDGGAASAGGCGGSSASASAAGAPAAATVVRLAPAPGSAPSSSSSSPAGARPGALQAVSPSVVSLGLIASVMPQELIPQVAGAAEALSVEALRARERCVAQLQLRRAQLLAAIASHLQCERERLEQLAAGAAASQGQAASGASSSSAAPGARATTELAEALTAAVHEARSLCSRAETVSGGKGDLAREEREAQRAPAVGDRCRARWMDGNFYDATVQRIPGDGTIVVNWLRPRPLGIGDASPAGKPLLTISEVGGDDSMHRIIPQEDVQLLGATARSPAAKEAFRHFDTRAAADEVCADCGGSPADWASISFGIYLCRKCAEEHGQLGCRVSLVRPLRDGWGWDSQELQYLVRGGNAAFLAQLARHPPVQRMAIGERYLTRFAEHYRKHLDAVCTGSPLPGSLPPDVAPLAAVSNEFVGAAEAVAVVRALVQEFESSMEALGARFTGHGSSRVRLFSTPPRGSGGGGGDVQKVGKVAAC